jgi:cell division protein FtsQ
MAKKDIIRRTLMLSAWVLVMVGITSLLIAANQKQRSEVCSRLIIGMRGGNGIYLEKNDILKLIERSNGNVLNNPVESIDIQRLERNLKLNSWVKDAEIYFDSKDALHVFVEERQPVARIFTSAGRSFYIDSSGHAMPLIEKISARVPVITGFPSGSKWNAEDSALMNEVKTVATLIYNDVFWNAQVGQVHINNERKFELIPVVGEHIIKLGNASGAEEKMRKLFVFYKQVLGKVGLNKYGVLDVQYEGQVVAVKRMPASPVDSLQLQKNIAELMERAMALVGDEGMLPHENIQTDQTVSRSLANTDQVSTKTNPDPIQAKIQSTPSKTQKIPTTSEKPKAVMKAPLRTEEQMNR